MRPATRTFYAVAVQRTIEQIARHLDGALDLHALAVEAGLSPFHFHRIFRGMVGETPLEIGRRLRMERAAWRLLHTDQPIVEIAFDAGYETHEAFTRSFRRCYGAPPSGFRGQGASQVELAAACGVHFDAGGRVPELVARDSGGQSMDAEIRQIPELRAGVVEHVGPYHQIAEAFARLGAIVGSAGLVGQPGAMMIALYYDDPDSTPPDELRSDAAIVVPEGVVLPAALREERLPAGRYACTVHVGSYAELGDVWARFMGEWLPASGHRAGAGACYESYLNTPGDVPEEELRTELYLPIA